MSVGDATTARVRVERATKQNLNYSFALRDRGDSFDTSTSIRQALTEDIVARDEWTMSTTFDDRFSRG